MTKNRIIIVDDDDDLRSTLRMMLEQLGYTIAEAVDGQDAQGQLMKADYDIMIL